MGDTNTSGQVGAMARGAQSHHSTFQQIWHDNSQSLELSILAPELGKLHTALRERAKEPEHLLSVGAVAAAEAAAKKGDGPKALECLRCVGKWALDAATE